MRGAVSPDAVILDLLRVGSLQELKDRLLGPPGSAEREAYDAGQPDAPDRGTLTGRFTGNQGNQLTLVIDGATAWKARPLIGHLRQLLVLEVAVF